VRLRIQPWQLAAGLVLLCAGAVFGIYWFRLRGNLDPAEMISYLPTRNAIVVYVDFDAIRRAGILQMVAGSKAAQELEYRQFVDQTLFDYRQDLDAAALAFKDDQVFLAVRGRFHWKNIMDYAVHQGGTCHNGFCSLEGSRPQRRISFYALRPNLMAMASGKDDYGAYEVNRNSGALAATPSDQPVWMFVPVAAIRNAGGLPDSIKPYASALRNADEVIFSLGSRDDHLELSLKVTCKDTVSASALLIDLESATNALRKEIEREQKKPEPGELTGVLVSGMFSRNDRSVYGEWPIPRAFVNTIAGEAY
jgi:hypothetical protein